MSRWAKHKGRRATAAADQTSTTSDERSTDTTTDTPAGASTDGATEHRDDAVQDSALLQGAPTIAESTGVRRPSPALDIFDGTAEDDGPGDDTRTSSDGSATVIDGSGLGLRQHGRDVFTGVDVRVGAGDLVVLQGAATVRSLSNNSMPSQGASPSATDTWSCAASPCRAVPARCATAWHWARCAGSTTSTTP